jgi:hypothetical protein
MNAATTILLLAAAAAQKARQDAENAFRLAGATSAARARPLDELGLADNSAVHGTLRAAGIVRAVGASGQVLAVDDAPTAATAWYLDEAVLLAERTAAARPRKLPRFLKIALGILVLLLLIGLMLVAPGSTDM